MDTQPESDTTSSETALCRSFYTQYVLEPGSRRFEAFIKQFVQEVEDKVPQLPVPASKEQCVAAADEFKKSWTEIWARHEAEKDRLEAWFHDAIKFHEQLVSKVSRDKDPERALILTGLKYIWSMRADTWRTLVQECLLSMVKLQNEELKSWFWKEVVGTYRREVTIVESTRPDTNFGDTGARSSLQAPVEVMQLVFESADLETCVALRRVSKAWYSCFSNIEKTLKSKLQNRNPWMKPGDVDLQTWADCALVFVSRKLDPKWEAHQALPKSWAILHGEDYYFRSLPKPVVGMEMGLGETLPNDFCAVSEEQCRLVYDELQGFWDPWTGSWNDESPYKVVRSDDKGTVVRCKDSEVTLHPSISPETLEPHKGVPNHPDADEVWFWTKAGDVLIFPPDNPQSLRHFKLKKPISDSFCRIGDLCCFSQPVPPQLSFTCPYLLSGWVGPRAEQYRAIRMHYTPIASYNGLVWCIFGRALVPCFVDLENGETPFHYRFDRRIFYPPNVRDLTRDPKRTHRPMTIQGDKSKGLSQFVIFDHSAILTVVDLVSGRTTEVQSSPLNSHPDHKFFIGFQQGEFQVRWIHQKNVKLVRDNIVQSLGIAEDEPEEGVGE
ncbi:hypothetical protein CJU90_4363 [Yarrowia sp. C11]|nr:hypothetical protein CKK34_6645 [Yarrowia sp. E02]KAG5365294.1 hypothetical protein CJU90_4363 [Yarrowia sp. C11]